MDLFHRFVKEVVQFAHIIEMELFEIMNSVLIFIELRQVRHIKVDHHQLMSGHVLYLSHHFIACLHVDIVSQNVQLGRAYSEFRKHENNMVDFWQYYRHLLALF